MEPVYCSAVEHAKDWNGRMAERIGRRVADYRKSSGTGGRPITAQALADRCAELGHPLDRSVIAKLEKGLRQTVTVADLLVLAAALEVPPIALVFAPAQEEETEMLPGHTVATWQGIEWFTGEAPMGPDSFSEWRRDPAGLTSYRWHQEYLRRWRSARMRADGARKAATTDRSEAEREARLREAAAHDREAATLETPLWDTRQQLRQQGFRLPQLPDSLQHIDADDFQPDRGWMHR